MTGLFRLLYRTNGFRTVFGAHFWQTLRIIFLDEGDEVLANVTAQVEGDT